MEVSVIIPVYNGEAFVEEALESVFAQTFRDFEVIVFNDGSTEGTGDRMAKTCRRTGAASGSTTRPDALSRF